MENLKILSKIALSFKDSCNFNQEMKERLLEIGEHMDVSRIYIFFDESRDIASNTFEWCNVEIDSQMKNLQKCKKTDMPS